jgi:CRISPR-associated protein Csc3
MSKKQKYSQNNDNVQQLTIWDEQDDYQDSMDDQDFAESSRDIDDDNSKRELITLKLFQDVIIKQNPDDSVMKDFAEYVLSPLLKASIGVTAKGGKWIEEKLAEGNMKSTRALEDQSLNTHILNGLFTANYIEKQLKKIKAQSTKYLQELERRIGIAGFVLHDYEKFNLLRFSEMPEKYKNLKDIRKLSIQEKREILDVIIRQLRLDYFINSRNTENYKQYLDDFLAIAENTQVRCGTNWNFSPNNGLSSKHYDQNPQKLISLTALACLADRLS